MYFRLFPNSFYQEESPGCFLTSLSWVHSKVIIINSLSIRIAIFLYTVGVGLLTLMRWTFIWCVLINSTEVFFRIAPLSIKIILGQPWCVKKLEKPSTISASIRAIADGFFRIYKMRLLLLGFLVTVAEKCRR